MGAGLCPGIQASVTFVRSSIVRSFASSLTWPAPRLRPSFLKR